MGLIIAILIIIGVDIIMVKMTKEPKKPKVTKIEVKPYRKQIPVKQYGIAKFVEVRHGH